MLIAIQVLFFLVTVWTVWQFWILPILRTRPSLNSLASRYDGFWRGLRAKFAGIKQKLLGAVAMAATAILGTHDFLIPYITQVDWTPITTKVPDWGWPLIMFAVLFMLDRFRKFADQRRGDG